MTDQPVVHNAVDAVRCLYLARVAKRDGHDDAAERWEAKAQEWMKHLGNTKPPNCNQS